MKLTAVTYNIRHGYDVGFDWSRLASHVNAVGADVVGFQEVDMGTARSLGLDSLKGLMEAVGFAYGRFIPAMEYNGGQYGTAMISRFPITSFEVFQLPDGNREPRSCGRAVLELGGREFTFLNTHLEYENAEIRLPQYEAVSEILPKEGAYLLTGDFNTEDAREFAPLLTGRSAALVNGGITAGGTEVLYKTFRQPPMAIDNMVYASDCMVLTAAGMVDSADSDHNLLWASFEI